MASDNDAMKYWAFICYRHIDNSPQRDGLGNRWADWLHDQIERYITPEELVSRNSRGEPVPARIYPVFQDEKELSTNASLDGMVRKALRQSRYLIVICSPRAVVSKYINEEIRYFKALGRGDRILPLIIDGEPNASSGNKDVEPESECFPEALRYKVGSDGHLIYDEPEIEPICADARGEDGREIRLRDRTNKDRLEAAKLKIIAGLLVVNLDDLVQREKARQLAQARSRQRSLTILSVVFCLLAVAAIIGGTIARQKMVEARQTLARSDFEEASRLLNDKNDTSKALAYLGSSLKHIPYSPALERLYGLMLQRSWLINKQNISIKKQSVISASLDHEAYISLKKSEPVVKLRSLFEGQGAPEVDIPAPMLPEYYTENGKVFVTNSKKNETNRFFLWLAENGKAVGNFTLKRGQNLFAMSPSGAIVVIQQADNVLTAIRTSTQEKLGELHLEPGHQWKYGELNEQGVSFDKDEAHLCIADIKNVQHSVRSSQKGLEGLSDNTPPQSKTSFRLRVYRINNWKKLIEIENVGELDKLAFSSGSHFILYSVFTGTGDNWELIAHPLSEDLTGWRHLLSGRILELRPSPDGVKTAAILWNQYELPASTLIVYDIFQGEKPRITVNLDHGAKHLAFSHDGRRLAVVTREPALRIIDMDEKGRDVVEKLPLNEECMGIAFSRDDCSLLVKTKQEVKVYAIQVSPLSSRKISPASKLPLFTVAVQPKGTIAAFGSTSFDSGSIELISLSGKKLCRPFRIDQGEGVNSLAFSPDGNLLAAGMGNWSKTVKNGTMYLFDISSLKTDTDDKRKIFFPEEIHKITTLAPVSKVSFSPDGNLIMLQYLSTHQHANQIDFYDLKQRKLLQTFIFHENFIEDVCISSDSQTVVTAGSDQTVRMWNLKHRKKITKDIRFDLIPVSIDLTSDGKKLVVGSRNLVIQGQVQLFSASGTPLWRSPLLWESGIHTVRFGPKGDVIAVALRSNEVFLYDTETGRPRAPVMVQQFPIKNLQFVSDQNRTVLCVACGTFNQGGYVEYWDIESGRRIGDRISHGNRVDGMKALPGGNLLSWASDAAVISRIPSKMLSNAWEKNIFPEITGGLGGMILNEWRTPEIAAKSFTSLLPSASDNTVWSQVLSWLATPVGQRHTEPGNNKGLLDELKNLAHGTFTERKKAMDIKPDFTPALSEYWFDAAVDLAEKTFMMPVQNKSAKEKREQKLQWDNEFTSRREELIFSYPQAKQIADFWTREACAKQPNESVVWKERSIFLRFIRDYPEASIAIKKALAHDPTNIEFRNQLLILYLAQENDMAALKECDTIQNQISHAVSPALGDIYYNGFECTQQRAKIYAFKHLATDTEWLLSQIKRVLEPSQYLTNVEVLTIQELSIRLSELLLRFDDGPWLASKANRELLKLFESKKSLSLIPQAVNEIQSNLLNNLAFSYLLQGKGELALQVINQALDKNRSSIYLYINKAHALYLAGHIDEALILYNTLITTDQLDEFTKNTVLIDIYYDFGMFAKRGVDLRKLHKIRKKLTTILASVLERGILIKQVIPGRQADRIGIQKGDRIVAYNGSSVLKVKEFKWALYTAPYRKLSGKAEIIVMRDNKKYKFICAQGPLGISLEPSILE